MKEERKYTGLWLLAGMERRGETGKRKRKEEEDRRERERKETAGADCWQEGREEERQGRWKERRNR